jgi:hypothetical protein
MIRYPILGLYGCNDPRSPIGDNLHAHPTRGSGEPVAWISEGRAIQMAVFTGSGLLPRIIISLGLDATCEDGAFCHHRLFMSAGVWLSSPRMATLTS